MSLEENINKIKESKIIIIKLWISNPILLKILCKYNTPVEIFVKEYAFGIFEHYISVLDKKSEIGNCPTIDKLLIYLQEHNVEISELFDICASFKNALVEFIYKNNIESLQMQQTIINIYERNFEGVLRSYSKNIKSKNDSLVVSSKLIDENIIMSSTNLKGIITDV